jgi:phage-related holin
MNVNTREDAQMTVNVVQNGSTPQWWAEPLNYLCLVGGWLISLAGGWDAPLRSLVILWVTDFFMAILATAVTRLPGEPIIRPNKARAGAVKAITYVLLIYAAVAVDRALGLDVGGSLLNRAASIRSLMLFYMIPAEFSSICEHAGAIGVPLPNYISRAVDAVIDQVLKARKGK